MNDNNYLYIVFSITPCKLGRFIRVMTGYSYNHVSVSLNPELDELYSFARRYNSAPFHGGFINESMLRFKNKGKCATLKVCAVPVDEAQLERIKNYLSEVKSDSQNYLYNTPSAVTSLFRRKIHIPNSFTCIEFAIEILSNYRSELGIDAKKFYSIHDLDDILNRYMIYEGSAMPYIENATWGSDLFPQKKSITEVISLSAASNWTVLKKLINRK